jgi:hypothetical protein
MCQFPTPIPERKVTLAAASVAFGAPLTWIIVVPKETPVTGTDTLVALAGMVTVGGTVATAGLSELKLTVKPPGSAGYVSLSVSRICLESPASVELDGNKLSVPATRTLWLADR